MMLTSDYVFVLIPLVPGLAFMLWVVWALEKQIRRDKRHRDAIGDAPERQDQIIPISPFVSSVAREHPLVRYRA